MIRVKRGNVRVKRRKKFLKLAKGYVGPNSRLFVYAKEQVTQGLNSAYKGRKLKKRSFRKLWISRINAAVRSKGTTYSSFMGLLRNKRILINRKILSLIIHEDFSLFNIIIRKVII